MDWLSIARWFWRGMGVFARILSFCRGIGWVLDKLQGPDE